MNDKTRDLSQQDSEELLVTSTSSSITVESTVSLSETETTESDTSITTGVCQVVTSSTGSNAFLSPNDEDDSIASNEDRIAGSSAEGKTASESPTMGGTSSNNDAETCVLPTSSNYIEQANDTTKNMVLTRSAGSSSEFSNMRADVLVSPTTSTAASVTTPTTRSKRKLMNEIGTNALSRSNSLSINNKALKLDIKNHQSPMVTRKSSAASINLLTNQDESARNDECFAYACKSTSATTSGKHPILGKIVLNDDDASSSTSTSKIVIKKNNCMNDLGGSEKVGESHDDKNDTRSCTTMSSGEGGEYDGSRIKSPVVGSCDNDDKNSTAGESRKVEPLKINLNRDAVKTKITIKPILKPSTMDSEGVVSPIPKLTIKPSLSSSAGCSSGDLKLTPNGSEQLPGEPHIVPKLTIRASDCNSSLSNAEVKHSVVPKLTIKMDGAMNCVKESMLNSSSASLSPPPLPKLTIKTSGDITESIISTHSPKASSSQCHIVSASSVSSSHSPTQITSVPKVTIKPIPKPSTSNGSGASEVTATVPKLTIKPIPPPSTTESSGIDSDCTDEAESSPPTTVPKLTIRTGIEPSVKIQHNETTNTIPKLTIRAIQEQVGGDSFEKSLTIPKFTIKSVQDSSQSIPKLTIAVNDLNTSTCRSSPTNEKVPKLMIRQVEQEETERIPKLMISSVQSSNDDTEKVPKLTIKQIQDPDVTEKIPKITIKSISEPEDLEKIPKLMIKSVVDSGESTEKVPKLTIRQVQESEDGEKVTKLKITAVSSIQDSDNVLSVPKLMIKQVQDDDEKVPKLTIISKTVCEDSARVRKLKIKPIPECSSSSSRGCASEGDLVDRLPKLEVRTSEPLDGEKIPKLTIRQVQENDSEGKVPKLTIVQSCSTSQSDKGFESRWTKFSETNRESNTEEKNLPIKVLKLSPKNELERFPGTSSFRKDEEKSEKEAIEARKSGAQIDCNAVDISNELKSQIVEMNQEELKEYDGQPIDEVDRVDVSEMIMEWKKDEALDKEVDPLIVSDLDKETKPEATIRIIETIDLESEPETSSGQEQKGARDSSKEVSSLKQHTDESENEVVLAEIIDLDHEPEIICLGEVFCEDLTPLAGVSDNEKSCDATNTSPNIPNELSTEAEDIKSFPIITASVDLTASSPESSPMHLQNEDINLKLLNEGIHETEIITNFDGDISNMPCATLQDPLENGRDPDSVQDDMSEGEKIFEINCIPISTESTQSPKTFSEQIVIENSEDMSLPSQDNLANSSSSHPSPFREEQSKSTENSNEPAHLDEKFLSNVDVLSCLGICQGNVNSTSFNIVDADDVLRRNNNKETVTTTATVVVNDESLDGSDHTSNKLKRCSDSDELPDIEIPPSKKARCDMEDVTTENAIPGSLSLESETSNSLLASTVPVECSTTVLKESSSIIESETSCDEKFRTLIELKTFDADGEAEGVEKIDESDIDMKSVFEEVKNNSGSAADSSQNDTSVNLSKTLESKIDIIQETQDNVRSIRTRQNVLLINEESGSDGMLVDECTSDPLTGFTNPVDDKKIQEVDSGVDISSSVKSESVPEMPVKRPRGRPRKDGKPAGSVKKPEKKMRENAGHQVRRKFRSSLTTDISNASSETAVVVTPRKRGYHRRILQNSTPRESVAPQLTTPDDTLSPQLSPELSPQQLTPHKLTPQKLTPQKVGLQEFAPKSFEKTEISPLTTTATPTRPLRGRGSRGGRISRAVGRGSRGGRGGRRGSTTPKNRSRGSIGSVPPSVKLEPSPEKDTTFFTTPERRKTIETKPPKTCPPALQVFEEDTRMSADSISAPAARQSEILNNEDTQSSMQSSASALEGSSTTIKKRAKMEVTAPEGKTEYTVDMIAEYDWPPPKGCCPAKNRDTFMIQEQIAQYLGIKSFKRKYPDLPRRQIEMEERNYLREKGMVTEKMCDLGITAVWASDVLDIMYSDFYDKYEEYKNYIRQKQLRDIEAKQKALAAEAVDKSLQARERALQSAAKWNSNFNKARKEDRRLCLDLQSLVIQIPSAVGKKLSRPNVTQQPPSHYPVALVPGQFAENYRSYTPQELRCYPINTVIDETDALGDRLRAKVERDDSSGSESGSCDSSSSASGSESSSGESDSDANSSSDEDEPPDGHLKCFVCHQSQNKNRHGMPEVFIRCVTCRRRTHPSCIEMPRRMVNRVRNYNWQCAECKCCIKCKRKQEDNKMLFCEQCDRGYHIYCLQIKNIPEGRWHCERCAVCMRCGSRKPEGNLPPPTPPIPNQEDKKKSSKKKAKWVHEYKIDHLTKIREHFSILCVPCARLKTARPKT